MAALLRLLMYSITSAKVFFHIALWAVLYNTLPTWELGILGVMAVGLPLFASLTVSSLLFVAYFYGIMYYLLKRQDSVEKTPEQMLSESMNG